MHVSNEQTKLGIILDSAFARAAAQAQTIGIPTAYLEDGQVKIVAPLSIVPSSLDGIASRNLAPALHGYDPPKRKEAPESPERKILRVFAGPNGSGKSTIANEVMAAFESGPFVNADEYAVAISADGCVDLAALGLETIANDLVAEWSCTLWFRDNPRFRFATSLSTCGRSLKCDCESRDIIAAMLSEAVLRALLTARTIVSYETVLSDPRKIELLQFARSLGFDVYLYFVCTDAPSLNVERVKQRVAAGGHNVPTDKIIDRYGKTLAILPNVIELTYRAYLIDNSWCNNAGESAATSLCVEYFQREAKTLYRVPLPSWTERVLGG